MNKIKNFAIKHKIVSAIIILAIIFAGYRIIGGGSGGTETRYVLAAATKGTLLSTVTGTGQVAASDQQDLKSQVSGDITRLAVSEGQAVFSGQIIASIDAADAIRTVDNAKLSLSNAQLSYQKAQKEAQDQSASSNVSDLKTAYDDGYQAVADTFIDLPNIISDLDNILNNSSHSPYLNNIQLKSSSGALAVQYKDQAVADFYQAQKEYKANFKSYQASTINSNQATITALLKQTKQTVSDISITANGTNSTINYANDRLDDPKPSEIATDKSTLSSDISKINSHLSAITSAIKSIETAKTSSGDADLNLQSARLSVSQAEASLSDAQTALADHSIRAPFTGIVADIPVKVGDTISSGTTIATVITKEQVAEISLNEVDAAKVAAGQKATLTFDAIDGLTLTGKVAAIDVLGTVSQGVVTYNVKIALDTGDNRVKSGMSASAEIITDVKQDVLLVPNSAVKTQGNSSYVEELVNNLPEQVPVEVGVSNDTDTEIVSGLKEGDQIISRTIVGSATAATTPSAPSLLGGSRGGASAGGALRSLGGH